VKFRIKIEIRTTKLTELTAVEASTYTSILVTAPTVTRCAHLIFVEMMGRFTCIPTQISVQEYQSELKTDTYRRVTVVDLSARSPRYEADVYGQVKLRLHLLARLEEKYGFIKALEMASDIEAFRKFT
jgi:hypothetical protein